jgi:hypothetical protein
MQRIVQGFAGAPAPLVLVLFFSLSHASPAAALPLLSEVLYDASGADDGAVFVEIAGPAGLSLAGYRVEGVNGSGGGVTVSVELGGSIPADGVYVLADTLAGGGTDVAEADWLADFDFQNGPDSIVLLLADTVVDALGYGAFGAGDVFAGEGDPAPDAPAGASLARHFANVDSDDNARDWAVADTPTPGHAPRSEVPEPGAAALFGAGLLLLAGGRRRRARRP